MKQKWFSIGQKVYLHHVEGLLPATVVGKNTNGLEVQIIVHGWIGRHWTSVEHVVTEAEAEKMFADASQVMKRA